jgi:GDP-L-fucose synthase
MVIQINIINGAYRAGINKLMFLGSSCIYPKDSPQPILEEYLLSGPLEITNRPYAVAKIAGIEACWSYNRQFGTKYLSVMPTNLYGKNDNYHPKDSHVIPGLIRRFHDSIINKSSSVNIWGSGRARRDFLDVDDLSSACIDLARLQCNNRLDHLFENSIPPLINIGSGSEISIKDLSFMIRELMGYSGDLRFDYSIPDGTILKKLDISRLSRIIDFQPKPISLGLPKVINDFRNHLERYL